VSHDATGVCAVDRGGPRRGAGDAAIYATLRARALAISVEHPSPEARLQPLCDAFWEALAPRGVSWIGFYVAEAADGTIADSIAAEGAVDRSRSSMEAPRASGEPHLVLVARRDKPACSPIGLHGVCGQAFREELVRLVDDVALLGNAYVACDPRDRSEIVIPIYRNGVLWGVLDADSHEVACFGESDIDGLSGVLRVAGLLPRELTVRADRLRTAPPLL
jgi:putative methionine-R-sulfoxide reductase with GAF domain